MVTGPAQGRTTGAADTQSEAQSEAQSDAQMAWAAFDRLHLGYFNIDHRTGKVTRANNAFAQMFGYDTADDVLGVSVMQHYDDPKERAEAAARIYGHPDLKRQGFIRFEGQRTNTKTGAIVHVLFSLVPIWNENGEVIAVDGFAEQLASRQRTEKAFAESEERFRVLFDTGAIGQALVSPEGMVSRANVALARTLGQTAEQLTGRSLLDFVHPDDCAAAEAMLDPSQAVGGTAASAGQDWRLIHAAQQPVWGQVNGSWLYSDGKPHSLALFVLDVTHRKNLEETVLRMERLKAVGTLAGGIAHDFNNILAAIMGNLSLATAMIEGDDSVATLLRQAELAGMRARELTQQLITFAAGGSPIKAPISLEKIARDTAAYCLPRFGVVAEFDIEPDLCAVAGDAGQVGQVFQNLFVNAAEAVPNSGVITVRMRNCAAGQVEGPNGHLGRCVSVEVSDSGPGMTGPQLQRVFDAYYSTKRRGSGLGLATVLSIIKRHDGHIEASSAVGLGTTMRFWLQASNEDPTSDAERPTGISINFVGSLRVLVMDDEPLVLSATQTILERLGAKVAVAAEGNAAVEAHRDAVESGTPFDVVILDLTVHGGMGGVETLAAMRSVQPDVKAIVCSGYSTDPVMADPAAFGFSAVLPKPFSLAQLAEVVKSVTHGARDATGKTNY